MVYGLVCFILSNILTGCFTVEALSLALILASHSLLLVPTPKLKALSLPVRPSHFSLTTLTHPNLPQILAHHFTSTISSAFQSGSFLDSLPSSITPKDIYKIHISVRLHPNTLYCLLTFASISQRPPFPAPSLAFSLPHFIHLSHRSQS